MPTKTIVDERLATLQNEFQAKYDEADRILNDDNATGEAQVRAEKLYDECDSIKSQIEERQAELDRKAELKGRAAAFKEWVNEPARTIPFPTGKKSDEGAKFSVSGFEEAGHTQLGLFKGNPFYQAIGEAGPGTFGEKQWELMNSFEYKRDWAAYIRKGTKFLDGCKTLQNAIDDQGGVLAPAELINRIIGRSPAPTQLRSLVTTITTGRDSLIMPRKLYAADDKYTTAFRATWTGEIPSSSTAAEVNDQQLLGDVTIAVHTAMISGSMSKNSLEDSAFPLQAWLENQFNEVIDLLYEDMIINGSGTGQPDGLLLGAASGNNGTTTNPQYPEVVLSGSAAALAFDGLIDLQTALAPQYENEYTRWIMNKKSTYRALRKLKDLQNRPLFSAGYNDSGLMTKPGREMLGDPIILSQFMPDVGANNFPVAYGDLRGYYLAQRVGFSIQVLDQTRAKVNQVELVGRLRFGGRPVEPWRLKLQKSNNS